MNVRITNLLTKNEVTLTDVKSICSDSCELCICFAEDHEYKNIEEILDTLSRVLDIGVFNFHTGNYNYHFKGIDFYGNHCPDNATDVLLATDTTNVRYYIY